MLMYGFTICIFDNLFNNGAYEYQASNVHIYSAATLWWQAKSRDLTPKVVHYTYLNQSHIHRIIHTVFNSHTICYVDTKCFSRKII